MKISTFVSAVNWKLRSKFLNIIFTSEVEEYLSVMNHNLCHLLDYHPRLARLEFTRNAICARYDLVLSDLMLRAGKGTSIIEVLSEEFFDFNEFT